MDEHAARDVVLLRAIESADNAGEVFGLEERRQAGRTAAELARWDATQQHAAATDDMFLARRAQLALDALASRVPAVGAMRQARWRPWLGVALPLAALVLGAVTEQIADRQHVNVLAFPLLGVVAWNLAVYVAMLLRPLLGRRMGPLRRLLVAPKAAREFGGRVLPAAVPQFMTDWSAISAPLTNARAGRVLHLAAACFAIGALAGLYLRALAFEYRIGWESTFLQAPTVHAILATLLGPAARLLGMPFPDVAAIEAMRMTGGVGGTDAGLWIHLYAVTLGIVVIAPRLLLAAAAAWRERRLAADLPFDRGAPYFRRVLAGFSARAVRVRVAPYSHTLDEAANAGLQALARHLYGETTQVALRPSVAFGEEEVAAAGMLPHEDDVPLMLAVFNAAATPENENHGRFIDTLRAACDAPLAAIVDTGPYARRLGTAAGSDARLDERLRTWSAFAAARGVPLGAIDLGAPDLPAVERALADVPRPTA
jgi:hypothetical protein